MKKNLKIKKNAFTLLELMIVITIMGIILMFSYAPYTLYQNRAKVRLATREIAQSFSETKNMAISGIKNKNASGDFVNKQIGLFLDSKDGNNSEIKYFFYDHNMEFKDFSLNNPEKIKKIQDGVVFDGFETDAEKFEKIFILYPAIKGDIKIFSLDDSGIKKEISSDILKIKLSFKKSSSTFLNRTITYYLKTNIVNYK